MKIKKGDNIIVIAGKDKGKTGKVERIISKTNRVLVAGVNVVKRHQRTRGKTKGQIVDKAMPIHISNVMVAAGGKPSRVGFEMKGDKKVRIARKTGKEI